MRGKAQPNDCPSVELIETPVSFYSPTKWKRLTNCEIFSEQRPLAPER